ncbi:hydrolase 76 protein [Rhizoclosmatium sp. JEL0117]|nr:hydrolase 76 protein [Rhizoclosmatium sp. JEL0117]
MQQAVGPNVGFLDEITKKTGRWNDDIGWWALGVMSAAEATKDGILAPKNPIEGQNPRYIDVVNTTFIQMYEQWDDSCGGGMFWSRDRTTPKVNDAYYKSSITNAQHLDMGARLYAYTKNEMYREYVDRVYTWMLSSTLIDPVTYAVADGLDSRACAIDRTLFSYHSGELMSGLATMYKATGNQRYLDEAHKHFKHVASHFTFDNILYDPMRGPAPIMPNGFMWPVYRGIGVLYSITTDDSIKAQIRTIMAASAAFNFQPCNSIWYCIRDLDPSTDRTLWNGTSPRDQFEVVAILNALVVITGAPVIQHVQDKTPIVTGDGSTKSATGANTKLALYLGIGFGCVALILAILIVVLVVKRNKALRQQVAYSEREMYTSSSREKLVEGPRSGSKNNMGRGVPRRYDAGSNDYMDDGRNAGRNEGWDVRTPTGSTGDHSQGSGRSQSSRSRY